MELTLDLLDRTAGRIVDRSNANALITGLRTFPAGIEKPHRLAHFLGQVMHESMDLTYDREVWGPTAAQLRYDTRVDLGNTPVIDNDGFLNRGMGPIQLTGGDHRRAFRAWCVAEGFQDVPDFVATEALLSDPWEGLSAVWFWTSRDLNRYADNGDFENITRRVNGGTNGFDDRANRYARAGLAILNFDTNDLRGWQAANGLKPDGVPGPKTRSALHARLKAIVEEQEAPSLAVILATIDARLEAIEAHLRRLG